MILDVNKFAITGTVTSEPRLDMTRRGVAIASFMVETHTEYRDKNGVQPCVDDFRVLLKGKNAELLQVEKGDRVFIVGRLRSEDRITRVGRGYRVTVLNANRVYRINDDFDRLDEPERNLTSEV